MGTKIVIAVDVLHLELLAYQVSVFLLQIARDSTINILHVLFGWVHDVISNLICIFYSFFKLKYLLNQCRYL